MMIAFLGAGSSHAQVRSILRDRVREAIRGEEEKQEEKTEEEEESRREQEQERPATPSPFQKRMEESMMRALGFAELDFEDQYNFKSSMTMDFESYDPEEGEEQKVLYNMYFSDDHENFAMRFSGRNRDTGKEEQSLMIFDMKNKVLLMLTESEGEKQGLALNIDPGAEESETEYDDPPEHEGYTDEELFNILFNKTGRSKNIAGYQCEEFVSDDDTLKTELWLSRDARFDYSHAYSYMGGFQGLASEATGMQGIVMEMNMVDKETGSRAKMLVREINPNNPNTLDITGFSIVGFGGAGTGRD